MAKKAEGVKKAAEAAAEASPGIRRRLEALVRKAEEALKGGVAEKVVMGAPATVRKAGHLAKPKPILAAEKRLIDAITRQKRTSTGQLYTTKTPTGAGRFQSAKDVRGRRLLARGAVYGTTGTIAGAAGSAASTAAENKAAAIAKAEAEEREKRRAEDAKADYDQGMIDREKRKAAREKAAEEKTNGNGNGKGSGKGRGKKDDRVLPGIRPFGGAIAKVLLGKDEKFGGDKGLIDFLRPSEWGKDKEKKVAGKKRGGEVKGYKKGGAVKTAAKNASTKRSKPRGVGAAKRGYGKAMR